MKMKLIAVVLGVIAIAGVGCMSVPKGLHLHATYSGCTSGGEFCLPQGGGNFYYWPTHEIVVVPNASIKVVAHELCHSHQEQTIIEYYGRQPLTLDMTEWADTDEGQKWAVVEATSPPVDWTLSKNNILERFAESCARYLVRELPGMASQFPSEPMRDEYFAARDF